MRQYSSVDLLRFRQFCKEKENRHLSPMDLIRAYNAANPEISSKEKLANLAKAFRIDGLYKAVTGNVLPPQEEECEFCDGCGWYEGGKALRTHCQKCDGTGIKQKQ